MFLWEQSDWNVGFFAASSTLPFCIPWLKLTGQSAFGGPSKWGCWPECKFLNLQFTKSPINIRTKILTLCGEHWTLYCIWDHFPFLLSLSYSHWMLLFLSCFLQWKAGEFSIEESFTEDSDVRTSCQRPLLEDYAQCLGWKEEMWCSLPCWAFPAGEVESKPFFTLTFVRFCFCFCF